ncbi:hypothetical protein A9Q99_12780 [Gammaproteobacteria bacterium 45_16_T64]|nr:hypothetical protein A9Q99_12780 [Gammaproteobacteria bacterium 45_16_T64]
MTANMASAFEKHYTYLLQDSRMRTPTMRFANIYLAPERLQQIVLLITLLVSPVSFAFDFEEQLQISGFLSFGAGITDAEPYPGGNNPNDPEDNNNSEEETPKYTAGSGRFILDDQLSFEQDTRAGIQFDFEIDEKTVATLQFVSKAAINNYDPELSWAYLSHQLLPDLTVRGGRFRLPIYLASDYLDVGLAYPWIRPPTEVYSTINMSNLTGVDLLYSVQIGDWIWSTQPFIGTSVFERGDFTAEFDNLYGISTTFTQDYFTFRLAYMEYEFSIEPWPFNDSHASLVDALLLVGLDELLEYHDPNQEITRFLTAGIQFAISQWTLQSEWARRKNPEGGPAVDGYYITLQYQWQRWHSHMTIAGRKELNEDDRFHSDLDQLIIISPTLAANFIAFNHAGIGTEDNESDSLTLGVSYSFSETMIGKLELSRIENKESTGFFEYATEDDINHILSFVIDVIF